MSIRVRAYHMQVPMHMRGAGRGLERAGAWSGLENTLYK
jgi:hypothetical protein